MQESIGVIALVMVVAVSLSLFAFTAYQNNYIASQQEYAQQLLAYKANQNANATFNRQSNQFELTMRSQGGLVNSILLNLGGTVSEAKYENCQFIGPLTIIRVESGGTCTQNGVYVAVGQVLTVQVQGATPQALGFVTSLGNAYWASDPFASLGGSFPFPPPPPPSHGSGGGSGGSGGSGGGSGGSSGSTTSRTHICCYCWPYDRHGTCVASPFLSTSTMNPTEILSMILWFAVMVLPLFKIRAGNYLNTEKNRKTCETPR